MYPPYPVADVAFDLFDATGLPENRRPRLPAVLEVHLAQPSRERNPLDLPALGQACPTFAFDALPPPFVGAGTRLAEQGSVRVPDPSRAAARAGSRRAKFAGGRAALAAGEREAGRGLCPEHDAREFSA